MKKTMIKGSSARVRRIVKVARGLWQNVYGVDCHCQEALFAFSTKNVRQFSHRDLTCVEQGVLSKFLIFETPFFRASLVSESLSILQDYTVILIFCLD
jgi:hypothetical protein